MKIAVLGTGDVGRTMSEKLVELGHDVTLGTRDVTALRERSDGDVAMADWLDAHPALRVTSFAAAAEHGDVAFLATSGNVVLDVLRSVGGALHGKVVLDLTNPLDFSQGFPPRLAVCNDDSLGEQIQRAVPTAHVVKTLNTVTAAVMVNPALLGDGATTVFVSGDNAQAKQTARDLLAQLGWRDVLDLGDITTARGVEMWLALWVRVLQAQGTPLFNLRIVSSG